MHPTMSQTFHFSMLHLALTNIVNLMINELFEYVSNKLVSYDAQLYSFGPCIFIFEDDTSKTR